METIILYSANILVIVVIIGVGMGLFCLWYTYLRQRWHKKGILAFNYDGWAHRNDPDHKTLFDCMREEREYDRKLKEKDGD